MSIVMTEATGVQEQLAALQQMTPKEIREQWDAMMAVPPPGVRIHHLRRRMIYRVQELAFGGLSPAVAAALEAIGNTGVGRTERLPERESPPGTRFIREWRGQRHEATALADGFEYKGKRYNSLTAVAKAITGQHTNGRIFFGLKKRKGDGK